MIRLVILGAGGHAMEVLDVVEAVNAQIRTFEFLGFLDDGNPGVEALADRDVSVLGNVSEIEDLGAWHLVGIGDPLARSHVAERLFGLNTAAATVVHPSATRGRNVEISEGCVIAAGVHMSTNIRLGRHVQLNFGTTIGHDSDIGEFVTTAQGVHIGGNVEVGAGTFLGAGSVIIQGRKIGAGAIVGAGSVVIHDVPAGERVVGVPARPLIGGSGSRPVGDFRP